MPLSHLTIAGLPQTVSTLTILGAEGPVFIDAVALELTIYPPNSPALHARLHAADALPPLDSAQPSFDAALSVGQAQVARDLDLLAHLICDWSLREPYSVGAFKDLIAQFPALYSPLQTQVLEAYAAAGKPSAA